jgi:type IV secretory pathway VirB10-like protein
MATADPMSPDASPGGATPKGGLITGVRRVNNWPLYIIGGLVVVFLLVVLMVVVERGNEQRVTTDDLQKPKEGTTSMDMARQVAGSAEGGEVAASGAPLPPTVPGTMGNPTMVPGPVALDENGVPIAPVNPDMPPVPPGGSAGNYSGPQILPEVQSRRQRAEAIRAAKDQMFTDAVRAPTNIKMAAARSAGSPASGNPNGTTAQRLDALRQQIAAAAAEGTAPQASDLQQIAALQGQMAANGGGMNATGQQQQGRDLGQFGNRQGGDRWQLDSQPTGPRTRYQLTAGFVIPGTLISGINSELPGQIVAQVSQNVFDSATGKYLLIPQGARLVGSYSADVQYGQSRVLVAWQRIVFPDGKAMDIGAMPGSDSAGYGGFKDKVNNHYFRIFGSALFMSAVTAGATLSQPQSNFNNNGNNRQSAGSALSEALGQQLGQATAMMIQKNLNISPTLMIRPGFRFNVVVTKDLAFSKPYRAFDY